jgi:integrase
VKRPNGEGTIRKRKNGSWEGKYVAGRDKDGKLIRRSVYGRTQAEVSKKLTALTNDLNNGVYITPDQITVAEWFDLWTSEYLGSVKEATKAQYDYQKRIHIVPELGRIQLQKLTAPMIQRFYNKKLESGLSAKSIKNLHGILHRSLNQAVLCQYLKVNPSLACQLPRVEKKEMKTITGDDLKAFLAEIKGKPYEDELYFAIFTGLREAEIVGLSWDCVDFDKQIIRVVKQLKRERKFSGNNEYVFDTLKNGKTRVVSPAPAVFTLLRKVKTRQAEYRLKAGENYQNEYNLVFTDELGHHISTSTMYHAFKSRVAAIGLPDVRFHDLRHSFATISIENGDDIKTVSENLGHATVAFTLDVYGHVTDKMRKDSADRMQKYINSIGG